MMLPLAYVVVVCLWQEWVDGKMLTYEERFRVLESQGNQYQEQLKSYKEQLSNYKEHIDHMQTLLKPFVSFNYYVPA